MRSGHEDSWNIARRLPAKCEHLCVQLTALCFQFMRIPIFSFGCANLLYKFNSFKWLDFVSILTLLIYHNWKFVHNYAPLRYQRSVYLWRPTGLYARESNLVEKNFWCLYSNLQIESALCTWRDSKVASSFDTWQSLQHYTMLLNVSLLL